MPGKLPPAKPELPPDRETNESGWVTVTAVYRAPSKATRVAVELGYRWAANGRVEWFDVSFDATEPLQPRKVRLGTVHFQPRGCKTPEERCRKFGPLIDEAPRQKADIVVLPEVFTLYDSGRTCAEPIPRPATEYLGTLAAKHDLYVVAGSFRKASSHPLGLTTPNGPFQRSSSNPRNH